MEAMKEAAREGNIDRMYELIDVDPNLLDRIDEIPFLHTPLHIAMESGCTHFALEIMRLKPSLGKKLNSAGHSPVDLALRNGNTEIVRRLVEIDSELIRVKGKEAWTPLHHVAKIGDADLLAEFLISCPLSISDLTIRKENAVHVAAANGKTHALKVLIGWLQRTGKNNVLQWKDEKGNTVLHIVASNYQHYANNLLEVLKILHKKIANGERNADRLKALDIILQSGIPTQQKDAAKRVLRGQRTYSSFHTFAEFLSSPEMILEKVLRFDINVRMSVPIETVNALLVVAALIVTSTYQAVLQPPTGLRNPLNSRHSTSRNSFDKSNATPEPFLTLNTMTFALSIGIIICLLKVSRSSAPVHFSLVFLYLNYMALIWSRNDSIRPILVSLVTFLINYLILVGRMSMALLEYKGVIREYFTFGICNSIISRLEMQHQAIGSIYSWGKRHQD